MEQEERKRIMVIGIIDSGINAAHVAFGGKLKIKERHHFYKDCEGAIHHDSDISDDIGHGTSVCWIINKYLPDAEFAIFKVFSKDTDADEDLLIHTFEYIKEHIFCDILNVSAGIQICSNIGHFNTLCDALHQSGTIIVSAFDCEGGLSYPACFDSVIGVDISASSFRPKDYFCIDHSPINIRGFGYTQKLPSLLNQYSEQKGASFVAPIIVGILAEMKARGDTDKPLEFLRKHAKECYSGNFETVKRLPKIRTVSIFPFSKETKVLIENAGMLSFKIKHMYDLKYSGNVGKTMTQLTYQGCNVEPYLAEMEVETIDQVDFSDVDTLIIGHINMLQKASGNRNIKLELIEKALASDIQVYMFDNLGLPKELNEKINTPYYRIICPSVKNANVPKQRYGRLYCLSVPVLGIFGTSPKQGKFSLQLKLRKALSEVGYKVANVGTEPTSLLFGFEETYPIGFNSTVEVSGENAVLYLNQRMHCIEETGPDLIIVGSQSQSVTNGVESIGYMSIRQHELILGTCPDAYILLVNVTDDIEYIHRTISFLSSVTPSKVIALVLSPLIYQIEGGYQTKLLHCMDSNELERELKNLEAEFGIASFALNDEEIATKLRITIEEFYS